MKAITKLMSLALVLASTSALAQDNLVLNPGFDNDISDWLTSTADVTWVAMDREGNASSGAAQVTDPTNTRRVTNGPWLCFPAEAGTDIEAGVYGLVQTDQREGVVTNMTLIQHESDDCDPDTALVFTYANEPVTPGEWRLHDLLIRTGIGTRSVSMYLSVYVSDDSTDPVEALFDDAFYIEVARDQFIVDASMTGSWYDPEQSGHGVMIQMIDTKRVWMCWYTFDLEGTPAWICALGFPQTKRLYFSQAFTMEGGQFPPLYDPDMVTQVPWGQITITFDNCEEGVMSWTTSEVNFESGRMPLRRIAPTFGVECEAPEAAQSESR